MTAVTQLLLRTSRTLSNRHNENSITYGFLLGAFLLLGLSFTGIILQMDTVGNLEYRRSFSVLVYAIASFDLIAITTKYVRRIMIEPIHILVYPLSNWQKYKFHLILLMSDYKSLLYIVPSALFFIYYYINISIIAALFSIVLWFFVFIGVQSSFIALYLLADNLLNKYRNYAFYIGFTPLIVLQIMIYSESNSILYIPMISSTGNALYGLMVLDGSIVFINALQSVLSIVLILICIISYRFRLN